MGSVYVVTAAATLESIMSKIMAILVLLVVLSVLLVPSTRGMSIADSNAEIIRSSYGFYGLPNYRPYGFTYGGYGSTGYGYLNTYMASPNIYGGYIRYLA